MKDRIPHTADMFGKGRIYADAAAATPVDRRVLRRMENLTKFYGNPGGLHKEGIEAKRELKKARKEIADTLGAHPDEIIFVSGGTEANNLGLLGSLHVLLRQGKKIRAITSAIEHSSVLEPLRELKKYGLDLIELPVDGEGVLDVKALKEMINNETALVSIQLVNSEVGTIQPIREIAKEIRHVRKSREGDIPLLFHIDAAQAPLWIPLKVESLGVDLLSLDAQKMLGPKGVGVLYLKRGVQVDSIIFGGGQERGLRSGTENVALAGACAEALSLAQRGAEKNSKHISEVRDQLLGEIKKYIPDVEVNGSVKKRVANNLNISIPKLEGETATIALDALGIAVSTRSACDTADENPSYVLKALGLSNDRSKEGIRITLLPTTTKKEAEAIAKALKKVRDLYGK